jgi:hypothetical protein
MTSKPKRSTVHVSDEHAAPSKRTALEILDEVSHQAAQAAVARRKSTATEREWSRALGKKLDDRLAELRRNLTPADPPMEIAKPIRPSTLAMTRDAVIAAITALTQSMGGAVQFAHRNLKRLSDDDLRRLFDMLDPTASE